MKKLFPLIFLSLILAGCHPEKSAVRDLERLTERVETKSDRWSEADWDDALMNFSEICETLEKYEYDKEQQQHIRELKVRCGKKLAKHKIFK